MGKNDKRDGNKGPRRELTQRPFGELRGMRVGPACLKCGEPVDVRFGASAIDQRGSRASQRQGFLHNDCESESRFAWCNSSKNNEIEVLVKDEKGRKHKKTLSLIETRKPKETDEVKEFPRTLEVPTMTAEEIEAIVTSKGGEVYPPYTENER